MKNILTYILILFLILPIFVSAQSISSKGLKLDISGGYTRSMYKRGSFQFGEYSRDGISGDLRIIYQSENLLGIGIETGYFPLATLKQDNFSNEFGSSAIRANISAIPIFVDFMFDFGNLYFNTGAGYYYISSRINAFGVKSSSKSFDFGFSFSFGYKKMINNKFGYGVEIKSHHLVDTPQLAFTLQLMFLCDLLKL